MLEPITSSVIWNVYFIISLSCHGMSRRIQAFCVITASVLGVAIKQTLYIYDIGVLELRRV